jgi:hypothetical protein
MGVDAWGEVSRWGDRPPENFRSRGRFHSGKENSTQEVMTGGWKRRRSRFGKGPDACLGFAWTHTRTPSPRQQAFY